MVEVRRSSRNGSVLGQSNRDQQHQQLESSKRSSNNNSNDSNTRNSFDPSLDEAFRKRVGNLDNKKVLIVDDDYVTRNVLGKLLEKMGYERM